MSRRQLITGFGGRWVATVLATGILFGLTAGQAAAEASLKDEAFAGHTPMSRAELQELRGGLNLNGAEISFSAVVTGANDGTQVFQTFLSFPADIAATTVVNGVGVINSGPNSPNVTAGNGTGSVVLTSGNNPAVSPQVIATFPTANLSLINSANNVNFAAGNEVSINISNGAAILGGVSMGAIRTVRNFGNSLQP